MCNPSKSAYRQLLARAFMYCAVLLGGLAMSDASTAMGTTGTSTGTSQQRARPVIAVHCPDPQGPISKSLSAELCRAVQAQLQQIAPTSVVRATNQAQVPPMPGSLLVQVIVGPQSPIALPARLRWKRQASGGWHTGPEVTLSVSDTQLSAAMMTRLARDLVKISALPVSGAALSPKVRPAFNPEQDPIIPPTTTG
jgi:hypothetical protein